MVALRSQGNWRWEGPLGTPLSIINHSIKAQGGQGRLVLRTCQTLSKTLGCNRKQTQVRSLPAGEGGRQLRTSHSAD